MIIGIDGASRRNGKPDCRAAGSIFVTTNDLHYTNAIHKDQATNQQGELLGMINALTFISGAAEPGSTVYIITDSEYVFNAVNKDWITNWMNKGWVNAQGEPVKSKELWQEIATLQGVVLSLGLDLMVYHIKGHLVSIGKVTAAKSLAADPTGRDLFDMAWVKYEQAKAKKPEKFEDAKTLFERNHGHSVSDVVFKKFVVTNTVADYVAGTYLDEVEKQYSS